MEDPLAQEFVVLAREVQLDHPLDLPDPVARHAEPRERDLGRVANVIRGTETPEAAAQRLQDGLASWYKPQKP